MPRTEPDAEPRLLLEDYGKASQRWLEAYAAARDAYKRAAPSAPEARDSELQFLIDPGASRTERWLERFARQKADFGPYGGPPPNLSPHEVPELHLLLEDYAPGPRFVQALGKLVDRRNQPGRQDELRNGSASSTAEGANRNATTPPAVPRPGAVAAVAPAPPEPRAVELPGRRKAAAPASVAGAPASIAAEGLDLDLELDWEDAGSRALRRRSQISSLAVHAVWIASLLLLPHGVPPVLPDAETLRGMETVSLVAPPASVLAELTRRTPNQQEATKLFEGLAEPARPAVAVPAQPEPPRQVIQVPDPPKIEPRPAPPVPAPKLEVEKPGRPELADARSPAPGLTQPGQNRARLRPDELPMLNAPKKAESKLEVAQATATGLGRDGDLQIGNVRLNARPDEVIQAAVDSLVAGGGTQIVGDGYGSASVGGALPPSPGNRGSTLELLSDPKGVDFRPYLIQVLAAVRRNWFAVIPESARLGMNHGRVAIQFIISREGNVPKLVIANTSNVQALDHAAVAGISASVPFQPLPVEFSGNEIRLQFVFLYNVKR